MTRTAGCCQRANHWAPPLSKMLNSPHQLGARHAWAYGNQRDHDENTAQHKWRRLRNSGEVQSSGLVCVCYRECQLTEIIHTGRTSVAATAAPEMIEALN